MMDNIKQDIRYSVRMFLRFPVLTIVTVLSLALAIGSNTAIFSIVNSVIIRPLPFKDSDRLVKIWSVIENDRTSPRPVSYPDFSDLRSASNTLEDMTAYYSESVSLNDPNNPQRIEAEVVSASYFRLLGAQAARGRTFTDEEDSVRDTHQVVVISNQLWKTNFSSDGAPTDQTLRLNERDYTIVGVMPDGFNGISADAQVWLPMAMISAIRPSGVLTARNARWHEVLARLAPGVTMQQAESEIQLLMMNLERAHPESNTKRGGIVSSLTQETVGNISSIVIILFAVVLFVLLISCVNVANLLISRAAGRQKEIALRIALGANRKRLIEQLLTESVLLALIAGGLGIFLAFFSIDSLVRLSPVELPKFLHIEIDGIVLVFTLFVSVLTGLIFGIVPALQLSKLNINTYIKEGSIKSWDRFNRRASFGLVVVEIALSLVLLSGAGLMIRSFHQVQAMNAGFEPNNLLTMMINLPLLKYSKPQATLFSQQLIERVRSLPSVRYASFSSDIPFGDDSSVTNITVEGEPASSAGSDLRIYRHRVTPEYFSTFGIPIRQGRDFTLQDTEQTDRVVIVDETMAARIWPGSSPLGKRIKVGVSAEHPWITVVGVAADVKYSDLVQNPDPNMDMYFHLPQDQVLTLYLGVRTASEPANIVKAIRQQLQSLDPGLPLFNIATMEQRFGQQVGSFRFVTTMLIIFGFLALIMAAMGIYGVMSHTVAQRSHEIGIRMALGAQRFQVLQMVMRQGAIITMGGAVLGLGGATALTGYLSTLLYQISSTDLPTFALMTAVIAIVAMTACYLPAYKATKIDPMAVLREV